MATNKKAYMREYSRRRRLGKIEEPRPQLPRKKDIFEVAAMLAKAVGELLNEVDDYPDVGAVRAALAAYQQYWEED